jgi:DNA-binding NarL/FixJ family response regulator
MAIKVLIADYNPDYRALMRRLIENGSDEVEISGEAGSMMELINQLPEVMPDVLVIEPMLAPRNMRVMVEQARATNPQIRIVVASLLTNHQAEKSLVDAGVSGIVAKDKLHEKLLAEVLKATRTGKAGKQA